ncbi:MAG: hypothetical protein ABI091_15260 [Ferruginibacter sp.]
MSEIFVRELKSQDEAAFLAAMRRSQSLHLPWVKSPQTPQEFSNYFQRY